MLFLLFACTPPPEPAAPTPCAEGEVEDGGACVPEACGVGTWGDAPTDADTVFVDAAASDGDGSQDAPFATIQEGLDAAGGGIVVVAAGEYAENLVLESESDGLRIQGRCRELVTLVGDGESPLVGMRGAAASLTDLTLTGGNIGIEVVRSELVATRVTLVGNTTWGITAYDAMSAVTLEQVEVHDTRVDDAGDFGWGVDIQNGATLTMRRSVIRGNAGLGIVVYGRGTTAEVADTTVEGNVFGLYAADGATLTVTGSRFADNVGTALALYGATADVRDSEFVGTTDMPGSEGLGAGVVVGQGAQLTMDGSLVQGNAARGMDVYGADTSATVTGSRILDTVVGIGSDATESGRGVEVSAGAYILLEDCELAGNASAGILAAEGGSVGVTGSVFEANNYGVNINDATLEMTSSELRGNTVLGLLVSGGGTAVVHGSSVTDSVQSPEGLFGRGIVVKDGATLTLDQSTVAGNAEAGISVKGAGTSATISDTEVTATGRGRTQVMASGIAVDTDATIVLTDTTVSDTEGPGLLVVSDGELVGSGVELTRNAFAGAFVVGGALTLDASAIHDIQPDPYIGGGIGIFATSAYAASTLVVTGSDIGPAPYAGVWLSGNGSYQVSDTTLSGSSGAELGAWSVHGNAVFAWNAVQAWNGVDGLRLANNDFADADDVSVLLHGASATLASNGWADNGVDVVQQGCADVSPLGDADVSGIPNAEICPEGDVLIDTTFELRGIYLTETGAEP